MSAMTLQLKAPGYPTLPRVNKIRRLVQSLLTTRDVMKIFRRGELTILQWVKHQGLPHILIAGDQRNVVRYDREEVMAWARAHGKRLYLEEPQQVASEAVAV